jgi:hypothetical protein
MEGAISFYEVNKLYTRVKELEAENETLPKTKRRYMTEDGKVVGYLTAKKLGIIS